MDCVHTTDYGYLHFGALSILELGGEVSARAVAFQSDGSFRVLYGKPPAKRKMKVYRLYGETLDKEKDGEVHLRVSVAMQWPCKWG